jgi:hypothetical protein
VHGPSLTTPATLNMSTRKHWKYACRLAVQAEQQTIFGHRYSSNAAQVVGKAGSNVVDESQLAQVQGLSPTHVNISVIDVVKHSGTSWANMVLANNNNEQHSRKVMGKTVDVTTLMVAIDDKRRLFLGLMIVWNLCCGCVLSFL